MLIVSPLGAVAFALLRPSTTAAQTVDLRVSKIATSLIGSDIATVSPGQEFYYEIIVQTESTAAIDITLLDSFPAAAQP
jgi:hypothetical protein